MAHGMDAVSKSKLMKSMKENLDKANLERWARTEEGRAALAEEVRRRKSEKHNSEVKDTIKVGQLVWKDFLLEPDHDIENGKIEARIANRCSRIVKISDNTIETEMIYAVIDGHRCESFMDNWAADYKKGDKDFHFFDVLDPHVAKASGHIWWKVIPL